MENVALPFNTLKSFFFVFFLVVVFGIAIIIAIITLGTMRLSRVFFLWRIEKTMVVFQSFCFYNLIFYLIFFARVLHFVVLLVALECSCLSVRWMFGRILLLSLTTLLDCLNGLNVSSSGREFLI